MLWEHGLLIHDAAAHPCDTKQSGPSFFADNWLKTGADHMFGHNWKIKYPGVAYRLGTWFGTKVRLVRLQSLGPSFVDKRDARKNPALRCGIFACKERILLKTKIIRSDWWNLVS